MSKPRNRIATCPTCGHPVETDKAAAMLPPRQRALFEIVAAAGSPGISVSDAMARLYGDDPGGGPDDVIISVMARNINVRIQPLGLQLTCGRGAGATFRVIACR
jgi:hypothetical protein